MSRIAWGYMMLPFCDQGRVAHILRDDGSPACGASFYASAGQSSDVPESHKCGRCKRLRIARAS